MSLLGQDHAQSRIDSQQPLEPVTPWHRSAAMLLTSTNEKCADTAWRQSRRIHRYGHLFIPRSRSATLQTTHHFAQNSVQQFFVQAQHEAKKRAVVRRCSEF